MDSKTYWKNREEEYLKKNLKTEEEYKKEITRIYDRMMVQITKEINDFYVKYAKKEGITMSEAKKRVKKLDINAYAEKAKKYVKNKDFSDEANDEMRLYNLTMKVNRLEMLKAQIGLELVDGFDDLQKYFDQKLTERTLEEFERQAGILGKTIQNNTERAKVIVNASFHNATFSDRIWMNQTLLKSEISKLLQTGMIQGRNPRVLAAELTKKFGVNRRSAERLMITELARVQTEAQRQSLERNGFTEYTFIANGDCCPICAAIDGKHFKVKDMMPGENAAPMHPNCRCSSAPYEDDEEYEAWLDYLDKGGTTEEWNATGKAAWKSMRSQEKNNKKEIKLSDSTDKWAKEAKEELLKSERSLGKRSKETMEVYDTNGKFIMLKRGSSNSVRLSPIEYFKLKDAVVTHNHPSGGSFSVRDIKFLKSTLISELRVSTKECVYYIRKPKQWPKEIDTEEKIEKEMSSIKNSLKEKYKKMYNGGKIDKIERYRLFSDEVNEIFAERYGLEYGRETYE